MTRPVIVRTLAVMLASLTLLAIASVDRADAATHRANEVARLKAQVATLRAERRALRQQLAIAQPASLATAISQVRREVAYSQVIAPTASYGELVSLAAMDYVVGHVSAPLYGYASVNGGNGRQTADQIIKDGSGICGSAAMTFAAIVRNLGVKVRSVQFYYDAVNNHIADETFYNGGWHYYDPTFGAYFQSKGGKVLSISAARRLPNALAILRHDDTQLWYVVQVKAKPSAGYWLGDFGSDVAASTRVVLDGQPFSVHDEYIGDN